MENIFSQNDLKIILGSGSPRRKEIMKKMNLRFEVITSDVNESLPFGLSASETAKHLSLQKAESVAKLYGKDAVVIGSDTLLEHEGKPLGKPSDEKNALDILMSLSGKKHFVHTAIALVYNDRIMVDVDSTAVYMKPFSENEAKEYIKTGECMDKAGAYAIQGLGASLVDKIEGEFDTVVGLPSKLLLKMLAEITK